MGNLLVTPEMVYEERYCCSICYKPLHQNIARVNGRINLISRCTNKKNLHKYHTTCLLEIFDRREAKNCPFCSKKVNNARIIANFGRSIAAQYPTVIIRPVVSSDDIDDDQSEEDAKLKLGNKVEEFGKVMQFFQMGTRPYELLIGKREQVGDFLELNILYLEQIKEYLDKIPKAVQITKEYNEGVKLHEKGTRDYITALEWYLVAQKFG